MIGGLDTFGKFFAISTKGDNCFDCFLLLLLFWGFFCLFFVVVVLFVCCCCFFCCCFLFCFFVFIFIVFLLHAKHLLKKIYSVRKKQSPYVNKLFPDNLEPSTEGKNHFKRVVSPPLEVYPLRTISLFIKI